MDQSEYFVSVLDIHLLAGPNTRNYKAGVEVADANHLMFVGISKLLENEVDIMALCLASTSLHSGPPHELNLKICYSGKTKSLECSCSCAAGVRGECKHATALLVHLMR